MSTAVTQQQLQEVIDRVGVLENVHKDPINSAIIDEAKVLALLGELIEGRTMHVAYQFQRVGQRFPVLIKLLDFLKGKDDLITKQKRHITYLEGLSEIKTQLEHELQGCHRNDERLRNELAKEREAASKIKTDLVLACAQVAALSKEWKQHQHFIAGNKAKKKPTKKK